MSAVAESQMRVMLPSQIQDVGIFKLSRIPIGGDNADTQNLASTEAAPRNFEVLDDGSIRHLDGALEAKELVDRGREESEIILQALPLFGVPQ